MQVIINLEDKEIRTYLEDILSDFRVYSTSYLEVIAVKYKDAVVISDNVDNIKALSEQGIKCLAISKNPNFMEAQYFLNANAKGYANARMQKIHFSDAINCINNGGVWILPDIIDNMVKLINQSYKNDDSNLFDILNDREKIVANYIKDGLSNLQIAEILQLSERTIKTITSSIYQKLGVKNRIQFIMAVKNIE